MYMSRFKASEHSHRVCRGRWATKKTYNGFKYYSWKLFVVGLNAQLSYYIRVELISSGLIDMASLELSRGCGASPSFTFHIISVRVLAMKRWLLQQRYTTLYHAERTYYTATA